MADPDPPSGYEIRTWLSYDVFLDVPGRCLSRACSGAGYFFSYNSVYKLRIWASKTAPLFLHPAIT